MHSCSMLLLDQEFLQSGIEYFAMENLIEAEDLITNKKSRVLYQKFL